MTTPRSGQMFDGDPYGPIKSDGQEKGLSALEVRKLHTKADTDDSKLSVHHTLGIKNVQASPGDHNHDGLGSSRKIGAGLGLVLTGAKGGNVALTNLITMLKQVMEFTDSTT